ncbi:MAG: hypothetical protein DI568_06760 [Sphingomonas sp.]|nr:MAG: hypothetical protein DI568_06760 [Sphingomonas sp.]
MTSGAEEFPPRLFEAEEKVRRIAAGLLTCTLPRAAWTHEAHLAAVATLILDHPKITLEQQLPGIISRFNESVGGVNDDNQGYHETLTQFWIASARAYLAANPDGDLLQRVNNFILSPEGRRDAPLRHFSADRLFSVEARRHLVEPDLMRFEWATPDATSAPKL